MTVNSDIKFPETKLRNWCFGVQVLFYEWRAFMLLTAGTLTWKLLYHHNFMRSIVRPIDILDIKSAVVGETRIIVLFLYSSCLLSFAYHIYIDRSCIIVYFFVAICVTYSCEWRARREEKEKATVSSWRISNDTREDTAQRTLTLFYFSLFSRTRIGAD